MIWLNSAFIWVEQRLDVGQWFRRLYVIAATILTWQTVMFSFHFAKQALDAKAELIGVAAVIGAINAGVSIVQNAAFRSYLESKETAK